MISTAGGAIMAPMTAMLALLLAQELTEESYAKWLEFIRPKAAELKWQEIAWRPTYWESVVEAQEKEKPILLWAMNGHPLACT